MNNPTEEDIHRAAAIIEQLPQTGLLPTDLFLAISRRWVNAIVELVPVRHTSKKIEILLIRRPPDDPNWPNELHVPGTVLRATDLPRGVQSALERIRADELKLSAYDKTPTFVDFEFHQMKRGPELALVFYVDLTGIDMSVGVWTDSSELPNDIVEGQRNFIARACSAFATTASRTV